jgi:PKD domain
MSSVRKRLHIRELLLFGLCLAALAWPAAARGEASAFGELTRFGDPGNQAGQIDNEELKLITEHPQFEKSLKVREHLLGVEPTSNDVYVLDEPENFSQSHHTLPKSECEREEEPVPGECEAGFGPITRHFRVQKFAPNAKGEYLAVASAEFSEEIGPAKQHPELRFEYPFEAAAVEGIAVDPARKVLYILGVASREPTDTIDHSEEAVASTLFAFSTEANEHGELPPAGKEVTKGKAKVREAKLTGPGEHELEAQSDQPGRALLEPAGITVDPQTGEIIILAHEDHKGAEVDEPSSPEDHEVLQRILPGGESVPGAKGRYVDTQNFFHANVVPPNSPVVASPPSGEEVDVKFNGRIARVPYEFATAAAPEYVYQPPGDLGEGSGAAEGALEGDTAHGGGLSVTPAGESSTVFFGFSTIEEQLNTTPEGGATEGAITAIAGGTPAGWTGGQNLFAPRHGEPPYACALNPAHAETSTLVVAGSGGKVFVFAGEFDEKSVHEANEEPWYEGVEYPAVVELGPGGEGCPPASGGSLVPEVDKKLLVGSVKTSEPVTFSSWVLQADALKVEWDFGDGTSETVTNRFNCPADVPESDKFVLRNVRQCPSVSHTFARPGPAEVTEKIYTDDLATPTVTLTAHVSVVSDEQPPTAVATGPLEVDRNQEALFDGSGSSDPNGVNQIREYHWNFGDGREETTSLPTTVHRYANTGSYVVSLTVTDALGLTSAPNVLPRPLLVVEPKAKGEEIHAPQQSGAAAGGVAATTATHPSPPPPTPDVTLSNASLSASSGGLVPVTLFCASTDSCKGTLTLRGLVAVAVRHGKRKASESTFSVASFSLAGASHERIVLHLTAKARASLAHVHALDAQLTIFATDPAGASRTSHVPVLIHAPKPVRR